MVSRLSSLRKALAVSSRALSSLEATTSGRGISGGLQESCSSSVVRSRTDETSQLRATHPWMFALNRNVARSMSSLEAEAAEPRQATYYVEVVTGDVRGAGSNAPAAITLFGEGRL